MAPLAPRSLRAPSSPPAARAPRPLSLVGRALVAGVSVLDALQNATAPLTRTALLGRPLEAPPERPRPVILLGGMGNGRSSWKGWGESLQRDGFTPFVFPDPEHALGEVVAAAERLGGFIQAVRRQTGAAKVDLVGFSSGGHVARGYVQLLGGGAHVGSVVVVATANQGADDQGALEALGKVPLVGERLVRQVPLGTVEEQVGSPLMTALAATDAQRGDVAFTSIYSGAFDGINFPPEAAHLNGADNVVLWDEARLFGLPVHDNHYGILHWSAPAYEAARAALLKNLP